MKSPDRIMVRAFSGIPKNLHRQEGTVEIVYPDGSVAVWLDGDSRLTFFRRKEVMKLWPSLPQPERGK